MSEAPRIVVPGYSGARTWTCPDTGAEVESEVGGYWCPACRTIHTLGQVMQGGDDDDD